MMFQVGLQKNFRSGLRTECMATMTKIKDIMVNIQKYKCDYNKFYRKMTDYEKYLRTFREMRVVSITINIKYNLED